MTYKATRLGDVCTLFNGRAYKQKELLDAGTPVMRIQNLNGGNNWYYSDLKLPDNKYCDTGDLLYAWSGSFGPYIWSGSKAIYHYHIWKIVPSDKTDKKFLFYVLDSITHRIKSSGRGIALIHVTKTGMEDFKIPLPPLTTQKKIVEILDAAQRLIDTRKAQIAEMDALVQSLFYDMFGDTDWDRSNTLDLVVDPKKSIRSGPFGSALKHSEFTSEGIAVLGIDNAVDNTFKWKERRFITEEKYEKLKRYTVYPGDVIVTIMGTTGRVAVVPDDIPTSITTKHLASITFNRSKMIPLYFSYCLRFHPVVMHQLNIQKKGAIMDGLNLGVIKGLDLPVPPIDLQNTFADRVRKIEAQKAAMQNSLSELEDNFNALMQRAFKGELV